MMSFAPIIWLILVILMIVVEVATYQLVAVWFALGAAVALIVSLFDLSTTVQILVFVIVSLIALVLSRPMVKKLQSAPKEKTNADRIIGQTAKVLQPITPDQKGRVEVDGQDWAAAAQNKGDSFAAGEDVTIIRIEGVTLYVQKQ